MDEEDEYLYPEDFYEDDEEDDWDIDKKYWRKFVIKKIFNL